MTWLVSFLTSDSYTFSATARDLGVQLDQELTFAPQLHRLIVIAITNCNNCALFHILLLSMPSLLHGYVQPFILVCRLAGYLVLIASRADEKGFSG